MSSSTDSWDRTGKKNKSIADQNIDEKTSISVDKTGEGGLKASSYDLLNNSNTPTEVSQHLEENSMGFDQNGKTNKSMSGQSFGSKNSSLVDQSNEEGSKSASTNQYGNMNLQTGISQHSNGHTLTADQFGEEDMTISGQYSGGEVSAKKLEEESDWILDSENGKTDSISDFSNAFDKNSVESYQTDKNLNLVTGQQSGTKNLPSSVQSGEGDSKFNVNNQNSNMNSQLESLQQNEKNSINSNQTHTKNQSISDESSGSKSHQIAGQSGSLGSKPTSNIENGNMNSEQDASYHLNKDSKVNGQIGTNDNVMLDHHSNSRTTLVADQSSWQESWSGSKGENSNSSSQPGTSQHVKKNFVASHQSGKKENSESSHHSKGEINMGKANEEKINSGLNDANDEVMKDFSYQLEKNSTVSGQNGSSKYDKNLADKASSRAGQLNGDKFKTTLIIQNEKTESNMGASQLVDRNSSSFSQSEKKMGSIFEQHANTKVLQPTASMVSPTQQDSRPKLTTQHQSLIDSGEHYSSMSIFQDSEWSSPSIDHDGILSHHPSTTASTFIDDHGIQNSKASSSDGNHQGTLNQFSSRSTRNYEIKLVDEKTTATKSSSPNSTGQNDKKQLSMGMGWSNMKDKFQHLQNKKIQKLRNSTASYNQSLSDELKSLNKSIDLIDNVHSLLDDLSGSVMQSESTQPMSDWSTESLLASKPIKPVNQVRQSTPQLDIGGILDGSNPVENQVGGYEGVVKSTVKRPGMKSTARLMVKVSGRPQIQLNPEEILNSSKKIDDQVADMINNGLIPKPAGLEVKKSTNYPASVKTTTESSSPQGPQGPQRLFNLTGIFDGSLLGPLLNQFAANKSPDKIVKAQGIASTSNKTKIVSQLTMRKGRFFYKVNSTKIVTHNISSEFSIRNTKKTYLGKEPGEISGPKRNTSDDSEHKNSALITKNSISTYSSSSEPESLNVTANQDNPQSMAHKTATSMMSITMFASSSTPPPIPVFTLVASSMSTPNITNSSSPKFETSSKLVHTQNRNNRHRNNNRFFLLRDNEDISTTSHSTADHRTNSTSSTFTPSSVTVSTASPSPSPTSTSVPTSPPTTFPTTSTTASKTSLVTSLLRGLYTHTDNSDNTSRPVRTQDSFNHDRRRENTSISSGGHLIEENMRRINSSTRESENEVSEFEIIQPDETFSNDSADFRLNDVDDTESVLDSNETEHIDSHTTNIPVIDLQKPQSDVDPDMNGPFPRSTNTFLIKTFNVNNTDDTR